MNLRHLEVLIAVVECGSVTKASERLYIAQPSVSQTIAEIEKEYNILLFERLNKRLYLTNFGKVIYDRAKLLIKDYTLMCDMMTDNSLVNAIRIGASVTVGNCLLSKLMHDFKNKHDVTYDSVIVGNTENIVGHILNGSIDLAIVEGKVHADNICIETLCEDEVVLVGGQNYKINDNILHNFIVRETGSGTRELALECLASASLKVGNLWEISSTQAILEMLNCCDCATGISRRLVESQLLSGQLKQLSDKVMNRFFYLIKHKDKVVSKIMQDFILFTEKNIINK